MKEWFVIARMQCLGNMNMLQAQQSGLVLKVIWMVPGQDKYKTIYHRTCDKPIRTYEDVGTWRGLGS